MQQKKGVGGLVELVNQLIFNLSRGYPMFWDSYSPLCCIAYTVPVVEKCIVEFCVTAFVKKYESRLNDIW